MKPTLGGTLGGQMHSWATERSFSMMMGNREMQTTCGVDDTQLMLARDAGDERAGSQRDRAARSQMRRGCWPRAR
jgi:hypothetical protein